MDNVTIELQKNRRGEGWSVKRKREGGGMNA